MDLDELLKIANIKKVIERKEKKPESQKSAEAYKMNDDDEEYIFFLDCNLKQ